MRVVVFGSDHLGARIAETLLRDGCDVTVLATAGSPLAKLDLPDGLRRATVDPAHVDLAGLPDPAPVDVLVACTDEDELNLAAMLAALEAYPGVRIVLRQFNLRLGRLVSEHVAACESLSLSSLAAPTFAVAALAPGVRVAHTFGEQTLVFRESSAGDDTGRVVAAAPGGAIDLQPEPGRLAPDCPVLVAELADELPSYAASNRSAFIAPARRGVPGSTRLFGLALSYLGLVVLAATIYFSVRLAMPVFDAFYFVITTITSVGFGDYNLRESDAFSKLVGMVVMVSGVASLAVLFALVTNALVARQQAFERGQVRLRLRGHAVVCGLGVIGFRVAQTLRGLGHDVAIIEADEHGRFVAEARSEGFPVIVGDAAQESTLHYAAAESARAVVVCTNPDHANIEIALHARSLLGGIPIVIRLYDSDTARRVARIFDIGAAFSSTALGAVRFAAAATGSSRLAVVPFGDGEIEVHALHARAGETVGECRERIGGRAVAVARTGGRLEFDASDTTELGDGDSVVAVRLARG